MKRKIIIIYLGLLVGLLGANNTYAQCEIIVDTANITQVTCPGGSDGFANLTQTPYINYSWDNLTNGQRSEEHTSELQSRRKLVCRLLLEKKKKKNIL